MAGKRYGRPQSTRLSEPYPFELVSSSDDEDEVHSLTAVYMVDRILGARFTSFKPDEAHMQVDLTVKLISKCLDDKDGTSATWSPVELPVTDYTSEPRVPKFRGPDGELYEMEHAGKFAAFEAGSSRRRFVAVITDPNRMVQPEDLGEIVRDLIEVSAGRPTVASSPSLG